MIALLEKNDYPEPIPVFSPTEINPVPLFFFNLP
jgi:hypothetical protein